MRFVLDQDVDARLVKLLVGRGHEAWTVAQAGIPDAADDEISVYAATKRAVVLTHDVEFSARRRRNPIGQHVQFGFPEPDTLAIVEELIDELVLALEPFPDVFAYVNREGVNLHRKWT